LTENKPKCGTKKTKLKIFFSVAIFAALLFSSCKEKITEKQPDPEALLAEIQQRIDSLESFISAQPILKPATVGNGWGPLQTMQSVGAEFTQSLKIFNTLKDTVEVDFEKTLREGQVFWIGFDKKDTSKAVLFRYEENPATIHFLMLDSTGQWAYKIVEKPVNVRYAIYEGVLPPGGTLDKTLRSIGIPSEMVGVVNGVLECKINFATAQQGDKFKILLSETRYQDSVWIKGKVLYTSYAGRTIKHTETFLYQEADPKSSFNAHYTEEGEALIRSGLRYPLDRLHVSSGFGYRIHPILGVRKLHNGVDYRAGTGTPVYAVAEGSVLHSSYGEDNGNYIAIKHADNSQSWYLHLSQRGVSNGQKVRGGQVIGKVGSTGRSTGPHLHFSIKEPKGSWMDPLKKKMIATPKLEGAKLLALKEQIKASRGSLAKVEAAQPKSINDSLQATVKWIEI